MKTVLIVDDEHIIREQLKRIIDWNTLGFEICGEASNGKEALSFILEQNPSLVLIDICMPKMYGTDTIKRARENGYHGKFIILSSYSDFTYAQTAIHYGASFYLTKPVNKDELLSSVTNVKASLEEEHSNTDNIRLLTSKAKRTILHEIVTGIYSSTPIILDKLKEMNLIADIYQVVIYEKFGTKPDDASYSFADILKVANRENHTFDHFKEEGNEVILLKGSSALSKFQGFLVHYEQRTPQTGSPLDSLFLAYGRPVFDLNEIYLSYEEASTLLKRRFFCVQGQHTLGFAELPDVHKCNLEITDEKLNEYYNLLTDCLMAFNRKKLAETLFDLEEYAYHVKNDITSIRLFLADLYLRIKEKINHTYDTLKINFPTNAEAINYIENCHYLYEIILFLSEQMEKVFRAAGNSSGTTVLDDIIYYIDHNYQNDIKLKNIAPLFGYNSAYLGKIFNKTIGQNFNSYVDYKRVEQSKQLLMENHLKVYQIAEQVGYKSVDYYHKKFKDYVGMSPAEYRKKFLESDFTPPTHNF